MVLAGKVVGFHTFFCKMPWMSERKFAIDMARSSPRVCLLHAPTLVRSNHWRGASPSEVHTHAVFVRFVRFKTCFSGREKLEKKRVSEVGALPPRGGGGSLIFYMYIYFNVLFFFF